MCRQVDGCAHVEKVAAAVWWLVVLYGRDGSPVAWLPLCYVRLGVFCV